MKTALPPLDVTALRDEFPILSQEVNGHPLVYLDNAATTQKPREVIDALVRYYSEYNSNIHRGVHTLSQVATMAYEGVRTKVKRFLGGERDEEVVFTRGTTESINLVAEAWARPRLAEGDEILVTGMEHHSNIVPWQLVCAKTGAVLRHVPIDDRGELDLDDFRALLGPRTRLAAFVHVSNALGTINPVREMVAEAKQRGIATLVDGAQAVAHLPVDVRDIGCDFYALSSHKLYGPTGAGVLWAKREHLEEMEPYQGGGDMIRTVTFTGTTFNRIPHKFEAGTPAIAPVIGLGTAIDWLTRVGIDRLRVWEDELLGYAIERLSELPEIRFIGTARERTSVIGFLLGDIHAHDVGTLLDQQGIAVRAGHHCAQPVMDRFGVPATVRASLSAYNTRQDIDRLVESLRKAHAMLA